MTDALWHSPPRPRTWLKLPLQGELEVRSVEGKGVNTAGALEGTGGIWGKKEHIPWTHRPCCHLISRGNRWVKVHPDSWKLKDSAGNMLGLARPAQVRGPWGALGREQGPCLCPPRPLALNWPALGRGHLGGSCSGLQPGFGKGELYHNKKSIGVCVCIFESLL